jgi:membrane-bound lytic murein transglycosylase D
MARTGGRTFWEIYNALPQETRSYVPQFTAVIYAMNYAPYHNLYPDADSMFTLPPADTVVLNRQVDFAALSHHLQIDPKQLLFLNPTIRQAVSPEQVPFALTLPAEAAARFRAERQCFLDSCVGTPLADGPIRGAKRLSKKGMLASHDGTSIRRMTHKVHKGETLFAVARRYNIAVADLRHWNHLRANRLHKGQHLVVYKSSPAQKPALPPASESVAKAPAVLVGPPAPDSATAQPTLAVATEKQSQAKQAIEEEEAESPVPKAKSVRIAPLPKATSNAKERLHRASRTHQVQPGDTLWNIARRYEGLTVQRLMRLNGLTDKTLKVGQKLIVG